MTLENFSIRTLRPRAQELGVFLLYLAGAAIFTWPLPRELSRAVTDLADPLLNTWALAWIAHQVVRNPLALFDGNIFYPEHGTLAFSESLVGVGVPMAPLSWLTKSPVLVHNVALLLSIALSGYGAYRLARHVTGSGSAAAVAGSVFAFAPYRLNHLAHLQLQTTGFLPLAFLCLTRYAETGRRRHAAGIAFFLFMTFASSAYNGVFAWILLGIALPFEIRRSPSKAKGIALALALSAAAQLVIALPYVRLALARPLVRVERASARPSDYLRSQAHVHLALGLPEARAEQALFPGLVAIVLSTVGVLRGGSERWVYVLVGAAAFLGEPRARGRALPGSLRDCSGRFRNPRPGALRRLRSLRALHSLEPGRPPLGTACPLPRGAPARRVFRRPDSLRARPSPAPARL